EATWLLAQDAPILRVDVFLGERVQSLPGELPEPGIEGERRVADVVGQLPTRLVESILDHMGGFDPSGEAAIDPLGDHPLQPGAVACEQLFARPVITAPRELEQLLRRVSPC